jgi:hypothetical protein
MIESVFEEGKWGHSYLSTVRTSSSKEAAKKNFGGRLSYYPPAA